MTLNHFEKCSYKIDSVYYIMHSASQLFSRSCYDILNNINIKISWHVINRWYIIMWYISSQNDIPSIDDIPPWHIFTIWHVITWWYTIMRCYNMMACHHVMLHHHALWWCHIFNCSQRNRWRRIILEPSNIIMLWLN